jgi:hypothetical protein
MGEVKALANFRFIYMSRESNRHNHLFVNEVKYLDIWSHPSYDTLDTPNRTVQIYLLDVWSWNYPLPQFWAHLSYKQYILFIVPSSLHDRDPSHKIVQKNHLHQHFLSNTHTHTHSLASWTNIYNNNSVSISAFPIIAFLCVQRLFISSFWDIMIWSTFFDWPNLLYMQKKMCWQFCCAFHSVMNMSDVISRKCCKIFCCICLAKKPVYFAVEKILLKFLQWHVYIITQLGAHFEQTLQGLKLKRFSLDLIVFFMEKAELFC